MSYSVFDRIKNYKIFVHDEMDKTDISEEEILSAIDMCVPENASVIYYFRGWVFYKTSDESKFSIFCYRDLLQFDKIEECEKIILEECPDD